LPRLGDEAREGVTIPPARISDHPNAGRQIAIHVDAYSAAPVAAARIAIEGGSNSDPLQATRKIGY
jgi:hypothetical protein